MYDYLYLAIKQIIAAQVPEVKVFEWYQGQGTGNWKGGIKDAPMLCFRTYPTRVRSLGNGIQEADVEFDLILIEENLSEGDKRVIPNPTAHLRLASKIHSAVSGADMMISQLQGYEDLEGTEADVCIMNTADRLSINADHDNFQLMRTVQRFTTYVKDFSGNKQFTAAVAQLQVEDLTILP